MVGSAFEFATASQIVFGWGAAARLGEHATRLGRAPLLVGGSDPERYGAAMDSLRAAGLRPPLVSITGEPTTQQIEAGVERARAAGCDAVIAIGGGSPLDAGKAIAALLTNPGDPMDYLEVVGRGLPLRRPAAPILAVPTTAGTGSEVTRNAVLKAVEHAVKVSLRDVSMLPRLALVDPALTVTLPAQVTADCGLDALTQVIEPFVSSFANPMTDGICREGITRAARSLRRAVEQGDDAQARTDMALASLFGGIALANAKLGAVHGFAGPLGGMFEAPHGAICARLLPGVLEANALALAERDGPGDRELLARFDEIAVRVTGDPGATARDGVAWLRRLGDALGVKPLSAFGMQASDIESAAQKAARSSSMKGNPLVLPEATLTAILRDAL